MAEKLKDDELDLVSGGNFGDNSKQFFTRGAKEYEINCPRCKKPMKVAKTVQPGVGTLLSGTCPCGYIHEKYIHTVDE